MVSAHVPTSLNESQVSHVRQDYRARSRSSRKPCESPFTFPLCSRPLALVLLRTKKKDISTVREEMIVERREVEEKKERKKNRAALPAVARLALRNAYRDTWLRQCYFASGKLGRCNESYETWYVFIGGVLISQLVWYWGACFILYWLESKNLPYWRLLLLWNECWIIVYIKSSKPGINTIVDFSIN